MTNKKKLLSLFAAGAILTASFSVMPAVSTEAGASTYDPDPDDYVDYDMFDADCDTYEQQEKVDAVFERITRKSIESITYEDLEKIQTLNLSGLHMGAIPEAIEYMPRLRTLDLSDNLLRSGDAARFDPSGCIVLRSVDISNNYLTSVPAWFVSLDIPTKKIEKNLINTNGQRKLITDVPTYYFMVGDEVNENQLKNRILASIKLSDNEKLPTFFYDPENPPYNEDDPDDDQKAFEYDLDIDDWDVSSFLDSNNVVQSVKKAASTDVTVTLFSTSGSNPNTTVTIKIYFLDGEDPSSVRVRLETLISECEKYTKGDYTAESWNSFDAALKTAKAIETYANADSDMIKDALDSLNSAKKGLVAGISTETKKVLNDLIKISGNFKEQNYSKASWTRFSAAVDKLKEIAADPDASVKTANAAIKEYQDAQSALTGTALAVPDKAPKTDFDNVYGEDRNLTYTGVTADGYKYTWVINGRDITEPKELNPEIKYESPNEERIRLEVGSASDYQIISFAEKGTFPGAADITLDVSGRYKNGTYRLYRWNSGKQRSELLDEVSVKDGSVVIRLSEGGDYFISSVLQNFEMISNNFTIDHSKLTIASAFKKKYTVSEFRASLENGEAVTVLNADGTNTTESQTIATGMTATAANSDVSYTIIVPGDIDGDGNIMTLDAMEILRAIIGERELDTYAKRAAADITGDGWVRADDAVAILKYCIGMD